MNDYRGKAVLITGGTKGIGLATGLAFGRAGAHAYLTHSWGSADEDEVRQRFAAIGAPEPTIIEADASKEKEIPPLLDAIKAEHDRVEALISNVTVVPTTQGLASLSRRAFFKSLEYSTWPMVSYLKGIHKSFDAFPRYVVGVSTDGVDNYYQDYDYVALCKAILEVFCRYLGKHMAAEDIRINAVRTRNVITESALAIHGEAYPEFIRKYASESHFIEAEEVGNTIYALCSGLLDAMSGQVISVDRGGPFSDTLMSVYRRRDELGL